MKIRTVYFNAIDYDVGDKEDWVGNTLNGIIKYLERAEKVHIIDIKPCSCGNGIVYNIIYE